MCMISKASLAKAVSLLGMSFDWSTFGSVLYFVQLASLAKIKTAKCGSVKAHALETSVFNKENFKLFIHLSIIIILTKYHVCTLIKLNHYFR